MEGSTSTHLSGIPEVRTTPSPHRTPEGGCCLQNEMQMSLLLIHITPRHHVQAVTDNCAQGMTRKLKPTMLPHRVHDPQGTKHNHWSAPQNKLEGKPRADVSPTESRRGIRARNNEISQHISENS